MLWFHFPDNLDASYKKKELIFNYTGNNRIQLSISFVLRFSWHYISIETPVQNTHRNSGLSIAERKKKQLLTFSMSDEVSFPVLFRTGLDACHKREVHVGTYKRLMSYIVHLTVFFIGRSFAYIFTIRCSFCSGFPQADNFDNPHKMKVLIKIPHR